MTTPRDDPSSCPFEPPDEVGSRAIKGLGNLNLLHVFLVVLQSRNLTVAGEQLGLTQPAISHALRRLRHHLGDPLFVRTPLGMAPTDAARQLGGPLTEAFEIIARALQQHDRFDPASAARTFRLWMPYLSESRLLAPLLGLVNERAPSVAIEVPSLPWTEVKTALRAGSVDLAVGFSGELGAGFSSRILFDDKCVCIVRAGHPLRRRSPSPAEWAKLRFVVHDGDARGSLSSSGRLSAQHGTALQIAARVSHLIAALQIVQQTDLAMMLPSILMDGLNRERAFRALPLPFAMDGVALRLHWHERIVADPGVHWLRTQIQELFGCTTEAGAPQTNQR